MWCMYGDVWIIYARYQKCTNQECKRMGATSGPNKATAITGWKEEKRFGRINLKFGSRHAGNKADEHSLTSG